MAGVNPELGQQHEGMAAQMRGALTSIRQHVGENAVIAALTASGMVAAGVGASSAEAAPVTPDHVAASFAPDRTSVNGFTAGIKRSVYDHQVDIWAINRNSTDAAHFDVKVGHRDHYRTLIAGGAREYFVHFPNGRHLVTVKVGKTVVAQREVNSNS
ncbi:MAG TPA: hypothetical protein VHB51_00220 [Candidatus Saccharimonadales bacterium]|nr:hypothetical protein [Candidatus Saccharimonadales bacterium]